MLKARSTLLLGIVDHTLIPPPRPEGEEIHYFSPKMKAQGKSRKLETE